MGTVWFLSTSGHIDELEQIATSAGAAVAGSTLDETNDGLIAAAGAAARAQFDHIVVDAATLKTIFINNVLDTIRMENDQTHVILIVGKNAQTGDKVASRAVLNGIYTIIKDDDTLQDTLTSAFGERHTFAQAQRWVASLDTIPVSTFKTPAPVERVVEGETRVVEKVVHIHHGALIVAFCGVKPRCGTTHSALILARALSLGGARVAVVMGNENHYDSLKDWDSDVVETNTGFKFRDITFYHGQSPAATKEETFDVIILDLGELTGTNADEFQRADRSVIVSPCAPWDIDALEEVFNSVPTAIANQWFYIFNLCDRELYTYLSGQLHQRGSKRTIKGGFCPDPLYQGADKLNDVVKVCADRLAQKESAPKKTGFLRRRT